MFICKAVLFKTTLCRFFFYSEALKKCTNGLFYAYKAYYIHFYPTFLKKLKEFTKKCCIMSLKYIFFGVKVAE